VTLFLVIGLVGLMMLVVAMVVGDVFDGLLEGLGGVFSTEVIAGFLGAFGFGGALALALTGQTWLAWTVGLIAGVGLALAASWASRWLHRGDHTGSVRTSDLVERKATVVNAIPADGYGVVSLSVGGHLTRVNARATHPVEAGSEVVVVEVLSPTSVSVTPLFLP
jgi:membrane protein implicated in regulation of membrane protease activity